MTTYPPDTPRPDKPTPLNVQCLSFADDMGYQLDATSDYHHEHFGGLSQAEVIWEIYATDMYGNYRYRTCGEAQSRQNGKGEIYEVVEVFDAAILKSKVLRNAQVMSTAADAQVRAWGKISKSDLGSRVADYKVGSNERCIVFDHGGGIWYSARTGKAGRGLTKISRITYDEAQDIKPAHIQASASTTLAAEYAQIAFLGSAGMEHSEYWYDLRLKCIKDRPSSILWNEHTAQRLEWDDDGDPVFVNPDPEDRDTWYRANPGLVHGRIDITKLEDEWDRSTDPMPFMVEHLGVWLPPANRLTQGAKKLSGDTWAAAFDKKSKVASRYVIAIAADPGMSASAVAIAGWRLDGRMHVEVLEYDRNSGWVDGMLTAMFAKERPVAVVLDVSGTAAELSETIAQLCEERGKIPFRKYGKAQMALASSGLLTAFQEDNLRHVDNTGEIKLALEQSSVMSYGDNGWRWAEVSGKSSAPLVAITAASRAVERVSKRISAYEDDEEE